MKNLSEVIISNLKLSDLQEDFLKDFNRYQLTEYVRYKNKLGFSTKYDKFIEHWTEEKKREIIVFLRNCLKNSGIVLSAFYQNRVKGFACLPNKFYGENKEYIELSYIHVSYEMRNRGIGKRLFLSAVKSVKQLQAKKIYISSHPAVETQAFYDSVGCVPAQKIISEIYLREPLDIQLEYEL